MQILAPLSGKILTVDDRRFLWVGLSEDIIAEISLAGL